MLLLYQEDEVHILYVGNADELLAVVVGDFTKAALFR